MKKILLINTKYRIKGGEDSNINQEILDLKKNFEVELLEFDNRKLEIMDIVSFFIGSNPISNSILTKNWMNLIQTMLMFTILGLKQA